MPYAHHILQSFCAHGIAYCRYYMYIESYHIYILYVIYFTQHNIFWVHPCYSMCQNFIQFSWLNNTLLCVCLCIFLHLSIYLSSLSSIFICKYMYMALSHLLIHSSGDDIWIVFTFWLLCSIDCHMPFKRECVCPDACCKKSHTHTYWIPCHCERSEDRHTMMCLSEPSIKAWLDWIPYTYKIKGRVTEHFHYVEKGNVVPPGISHAWLIE